MAITILMNKKRRKLFSNIKNIAICQKNPFIPGEKLHYLWKEGIICERLRQFVATGDPLLTSISNLRKERKKGNLKYMFKACLI
jgi:hypothetical protein